jgi:hypothetical protein
MRKYLLLLVLLIVFISGCVQTSMYYWGNYSGTLYKYKKAPSDETLNTHIESIEKIIKESDYYNKKVPPGIYCEYAYYYMLEGNNEDAKKYFELEKKLYPESTKFVDVLLQGMSVEKETE